MYPPSIYYILFLKPAFLKGCSVGDFFPTFPTLAVITVIWYIMIDLG